MKSTYSLEQLLPYIRQHSNFYSKQLEHLPPQGITLKDLPLTNAADYWADSHDLSHWSVLTGKVDDALVFKTGGSTSQGKLTVYTYNEWQVLVSTFG
ncbi:MAG: phenylacetate--CoA ligase family protein, partial [Pseudomonas sp.]